MERTQKHALKSYLDYVAYLYQKMDPLPEQERYEIGYRDFLQAPLQPFMDNLEAQTYEIFEKDIAKYIQLGLAEKNILNYDFDLVTSDPSDANTNSTMFSDDTDDKSRKSMNLGTCASTWQGDESNAAAAGGGPSEIQVIDLPDSPSDVPGSNDQQRVQNNFGPKKSELRIGQSSAFFTYVKSSMLRNSIQEISVPIDKVTPLSKIHKDSSLCGRQVDNQGQTPASENVPQHARMKRMHTWGGQMVSDMQEHEDIQAQKNHSHSEDAYMGEH